MSQVKQIIGRGIPLTGNDIDTDRIIPARFLRSITFEGLGEKVFADDRKELQGKHPFDLPQYQGATILVVNGNFGCGSSREHAPQAIIKWGIQAIVGESFAEIFFGNCIANGVPCLTADAEGIKQIQNLLETDPQTPLAVDLETMTVNSSVREIPITMNEGARQMVISGTWDSCGQLIQHLDDIHHTAQRLPYLYWNSAIAVN
ncbi:MAG: 3-isopropylmalate dehydratase small subunit [Snowella sp.]|nr:3-isopropylmalate dehydratase small subunit [Snowella sp.]